MTANEAGMVALGALVLALMAIVGLYLHSVPNARGLPHGRTM